ncbi:hypothetical protein X777_03861, partial [Ooceraea biroi]
ERRELRNSRRHYPCGFLVDHDGGGCAGKRGDLVHQPEETLDHQHPQGTAPDTRSARTSMRRRVPISSACMEPTDCRLMTTSIAATVAAAPQPSQPRNGTACEDCEATMNQKPVTGMDTLHCHGNPPPSRFPLVIVPSGV